MVADEERAELPPADPGVLGVFGLAPEATSAEIAARVAYLAGFRRPATELGIALLANLVRCLSRVVEARPSAIDSAMLTDGTVDWLGATSLPADGTARKLALMSLAADLGVRNIWSAMENLPRRGGRG